MGAAGLTSSSVEMASKGDLGIELELEKFLVGGKYDSYEMMLSESQERMLIILDDNKKEKQKKYLINGI